ncbi:MAG: adenosylcobinamide-phosphate synthase CbiB [Chloroflexi bacterium]|nr:adenosylcobinamide-phosphate synthase CbiB [Chloroflexota bacterium]
MKRKWDRRTAVILTATALDLALGDPPNALHPVAWVGRILGLLRGRAPQDRPATEMAYGAGMVLAAGALYVVPSVLLVRAVERRSRLAGLLIEAALLKSAFALRGLLAAGERVEEALAASDLPAARTSLGALVSRDTRELSAELVAAAAVESLAENLTDSVIAPLMAYRIGGLPAALAYRTLNTADAMIGYRGRYEYLGKPAARLDDVANLMPARVAALLIAAAAPLVGGSARRAIAVAWRDGGKTASPNAGLTMAAAAGALGVALEKVGHYRLGDAERPADAGTIAQTRRLIGAAAGLGIALLALTGRGKKKRRKTS